VLEFVLALISNVAMRWIKGRRDIVSEFHNKRFNDDHDKAAL
jgi:hypothetical protein